MVLTHIDSNQIGSIDATRASAGFSPHIQYLRGLAALSVLFFHLSANLIIVKSDAVLANVFGAKFGTYGVSTFFAISGYLMAVIVSKTKPFEFLAHRLLRIYPAYFAIVVLASGTFLLLVGSPLPASVAALSLVPFGAINYPLGVEWTLIYEVSFYAFIFAVSLVGAAKFMQVIAAAWLLLLLALLLSGHGVFVDRPMVWQVPISMNCTGFAAGLLIPRLLRSNISPWWIAPPAIVAISLVGPMNNEAYRFTAAGLIAAVVVACAVDLSRREIQFPVMIHRPLLLLGDISYALYLCHIPIVRLVYHFTRDTIDHDLMWVLACLLCLAVSIPLGILDVRSYRWMKQALTPRRSQRPSSPPLHGGSSEAVGIAIADKAGAP